MFKEAISDDRSEQLLQNPEEDSIAPDLIREELRRIVASRHFRTSRRGKEFLQYVVDQKISGKGDLLKERLIGVQIFGRKPDYATGEDPVVRVQAGDVRRRLESYHADPDVQPEVLIQIPVGSYAPVFLARKNVHPHETWTGLEASSQRPGVEAPEAAYSSSEEPGEANTRDLSELGLRAASVVPVLEPDTHHHESSSPDSKRWLVAIAGFACIALLIYIAMAYVRRSPDWTLKAFWAPASLSTKPVLICLPRPIVYRPSEKLYDKYAETHPDTFVTREARRDQILPLAPTDTIQWSDMTPVRNSGPGIGAVVAAVNISKLLAEQGIRFELRFGEEATYADMRDSPVVIVGAINTDWATQLTSESHFVFDETRAAPNIHETAGAKRLWQMESTNGNITRDYGLVTRQLSGRAGQFLVQVAGISHFGTEAASEFLANKKEFTEALRAKSINLKEKNFQIVVSTDVTAGRAGPPHIVAVTSW